MGCVVMLSLRSKVTVTHFCAVERTLASWSSREKLFCYCPCVLFASVGNGSFCYEKRRKAAAAFLPLPRQLLPFRVGSCVV